jgi:hypothetical protein
MDDDRAVSNTNFVQSPPFPFALVDVKPSSTQKAFSIQSVAQDVSKTAMASFTALTIASNLLAPLPAQASEMYDFAGSSTIVSEKVIREGLYQDYEVDLEQTRDDARSTFKPAKETKSKKGMLHFATEVVFAAAECSVVSHHYLQIKLMSATRKIHGFACCSDYGVFHYSDGSILLVCEG